MKNSMFKLVTGIAGLYHVLLAAIGLLFPVEITAKAFNVALGVNIAVTPQLGFIGKFIAVYMLAFGIMLLMIARNPIKYRALAYAAVALFGIRFLNRVLFFSLLTSTLGMTATRNLIGSALIFFFFIAILLTIPKNQS
jgi:hypothetical protein